MRKYILIVLLSSCVASDTHVDKGDDYLAEIGSIVASMTQKMATTDPTYLPEAIKADMLVPKLQRHAEEPATAAGVTAIGSAVTGGLEMWLGGGVGLVGLLGLARKAYTVYAGQQSMIKEVALQDPETAKDTLRKKNIHV